MAIIKWLKRIIGLLLISAIGYLNYFWYTADYDEWGDLGGLYLFCLIIIQLLSLILFLGMLMTIWSLKKENSRLKSRLESQED